MIRMSRFVVPLAVGASIFAPTSAGGANDGVRVAGVSGGPIIGASAPVTVQCSPPDRSSRFMVDLCDCGSSCDDETDCGILVAKLGKDVSCDVKEGEECSFDFMPPKKTMLDAAGYGRHFKVRVTDVNDDTYVSCSPPIELDPTDGADVYDPCSDEFAVRRLGEEFNNDWADDDGCYYLTEQGEEGEEGFCSNGVPGVDDGGDVCCKLECGDECGGVGCSKRDGDVTADDCCVTHIEEAGMLCSDSQGAPCIMGDDYSRSGIRARGGGGTVDNVITGGKKRAPHTGKRRRTGGDVSVASRSERSKIRAGSPVTVQCSPPDRNSRFVVDLCDCGSSCDDDTDCGVFVAELGKDVSCDVTEDEECSFDFTPPDRAMLDAAGYGRHFKVRVTDVNDDDYVSCSPPIELNPTDDDNVYDPCSDEFAVRRLGEEFNNDWADDDGCYYIAEQGEGEEGFCSNGIPGVDDGGDVCCKLECGDECGGVGCSNRDGDVTADDCCVTHIEEAAVLCSDTQGAPCIMGDGYARPSAGARGGGGNVDKVATRGKKRAPHKGKRPRTGGDVSVASRSERSKIRAGSPVTVQCSPPDRSSRFMIDLCDCGSSCDDDTDCGVFVAELDKDVSCDVKEGGECSFDFTPPEKAIPDIAGHGRHFKVRVTDVNDDTYVSCSPPIELDPTDDNDVYDPCSDEFAVRRLGEEFNNDWGDDDGCVDIAGQGEQGKEGLCSNGVPGVDDGGDICCKLECGDECGGVGCSKRDGNVTADDCCVTHIEEAGRLCSDSQGAPCIMGDGYTRSHD